MIRFGKECHIVYTQDKTPELRIVPKFSQCIELWGRNTRVSSLFTFSVDRCAQSPTRYLFDGDSHLLFCGLVNPHELFACLDRDSCKNAWLSLGQFNVVLEFSTKKESKPFRDHCKTNRVPYELWRIKEGKTTVADMYTPSEGIKEQWRKNLASVEKDVPAADYLEAFRETSALISTVMSESDALPEEYRDGIASFCKSMCDRFPDWANADARLKSLFLGETQNINSALSRVASQALAGTSPLKEMKCHFWSQSFLGVGLAVFGYHSVLAFLDRTVRSQCFRERVADFATVELFTSDNPNSFRSCSYIDRIPIPENSDPVVPTVGYFSARDGFRRTTFSISAPLAAISCASSFAWSLRTTTHEVSHGIIDEAYVSLAPFLRQRNENARILDHLKEIRFNYAKARNSLEEIRCHVCNAALGIFEEKTSESIASFETITLAKMGKVFQVADRDINEILTHTFDFLVFYQGVAPNYIESIWNSWCVIPHMESRLHDYLCRSICAVGANYLGGNAWCDEAKEVVLKKLKEMSLKKSQLKAAVKILETEWIDANGSHGPLFDKVMRRGALVNVVFHFLYSENVMVKTAGYKATTGKRAIDYTTLVIDDRMTTAPIKFLMEHPLKPDPNAVESAWMFYFLTFCVGGSDVGE